MNHPLCLFISTVNIVSNLKCLELNVDFRWQKNAKLGKIEKLNSHISITYFLIGVPLPRQNENSGGRWETI